MQEFRLKELKILLEFESQKFQALKMMMLLLLLLFLLLSLSSLWLWLSLLSL
jgi:hypothetical protein